MKVNIRKSFISKEDGIGWKADDGRPECMACYF